MSKIAVIGIVGESVFLSVDHFHEGGETIVAENLHREWGGKGFNQALAAARHGAQVSFLAAVNAREQENIAAFAMQNGIECQLCTKAEASPYAVILTDSAGQNHVTVYRGAVLNVQDVESFADRIKAADILLITNEVPEDVNLRAVQIAKSSGTKILLNPAPSRRLCSEILQSVDLFTPNEHETDGLEEKKNIVATLGSRGCLLKETGEIIPTPSIGQILDTTGAGDTFNGVLCAELACGTPLKRAAQIANSAAAIKVTRKYVAGAIPYRTETNKTAEEYYG